ncbi:unnamed protein product [Bathycoccus prasinos]
MSTTTTDQTPGSPKTATTTTERLAKEWLSAGVGCALSDTVFNPLEVLKVRRQIQASSNTSTTTTTFGLAQTAIKEADGSVVRGLWQPGLLATWMRGLSYTGFRIGLYPTVRDYYAEKLKRRSVGVRGMDGTSEEEENRTMSESEKFALKLLAGATTGAIGSAVFNPIDIVRIRMQSQPYRALSLGSEAAAARQKTFYPSTTRAFSMISREEGVVKGLWRGVGVCVARASLLSGSQLGTYDAVKRYLLLRGEREEDDEIEKTTTAPSPFLFKEDGPPLHFTCAFISGVVAQTVTQPVDTLKTLAMSSNANAASSGGGNKNSLSLAASVIRERGFFALYNGFWPAAMRQGPVMVLQMPIVEQLRRLCGLDYF